MIRCFDSGLTLSANRNASSSGGTSGWRNQTSLAIFSGGFFNLIAYRKGIKRGFNLGMMIILFVGGAFGIFIEIIDIIENIQKLR